MRRTGSRTNAPTDLETAKRSSAVRTGGPAVKGGSPARDDRDSSARLGCEEFERFAHIARRTIGLVLADHKRQMVSARLSRRLRALELDGFGDYLALLEGPRGAAELQEFANAVTTNLTSFFREHHHFDHLREQVLKQRLRMGRARLRIWSAGCSSGEEPYSILIAARSVGALPSRGELRVTASDIDTRMLARAREGRYREDQIAGIPADLRSGAFVRDGDGGVRIVSALRDAVEFHRVNLHERWPFEGPFDAIFCRNVLIYFDATAKAELVKRFAGALSEGGALYLGHSESLLGEHPALISEGRTIYRRRA